MDKVPLTLILELLALRHFETNSLVFELLSLQESISASSEKRGW